MDDGQVTVDNYNNFIESEFPLSIQEKINGTFWNCMQIGCK